MNNHTYINGQRRNARSEDGVYSLNKFERAFGLSGSEAHGENKQVQAETTPHSLTVEAGPGAANPTPGEAIVNLVELLNEDVNESWTETLAAGRRDHATLCVLATMCARHIVANISQSLHVLDAGARSTLVSRFGVEAESPTDHFWPVLRAILFMYFARFSEADWEPVEGFLPVDADEPPMAVWRTPDDKIVCDLLTLMTPWDSDEAIWNHVAAAMDAACDEYGDRLAGVRVIAPLAGYLARWYTPDGNWEPMFDYSAVLAELRSS